MSHTYLYESSDEESLETNIIVNKGKEVIRHMDTVHVSENDSINSDTDVNSDNSNDSDYGDNSELDNTILPEMKNGITFDELEKQTQINIVLRLRQLIKFHNLETKLENHKIKFKECLNYVKKINHYQKISTYRNATLALECYSKKNKIIVNKKIYKQHKQKPIIIKDLNKDEIKKPFLINFHN